MIDQKLPLRGKQSHRQGMLLLKLCICIEIMVKQGGGGARKVFLKGISLSNTHMLEDSLIVMTGLSCRGEGSFQEKGIAAPDEGCCRQWAVTLRELQHAECCILGKRRTPRHM